MKCAPISKESLNGIRNFNNISRIKSATYHAALLQENLNNLNYDQLGNIDVNFVKQLARNLEHLRNTLNSI